MIKEVLHIKYLRNQNAKYSLWQSKSNYWPTRDRVVWNHQVVKGENLAPLDNQCFGLDELESVANKYPNRRKISYLKTRADRAL